MFGARGRMQNFRGGRGAGPRTRTGTYENRYHALHSDSEGDTWQLVDRDNMNKGRYKRMRRSTGGAMISLDSL